MILPFFLKTLIELKKYAINELKRSVRKVAKPTLVNSNNINKKALLKIAFNVPAIKNLENLFLINKSINGFYNYIINLYIIFDNLEINNIFI